VKLAWIVAALGLLLAACTSPEATRLRGQGHGGDVRNVGEVARMHEGSDPYWRTPRARGVGTPPIDSARQADRLSR
jgi:hypothetical protein